MAIRDDQELNRHSIAVRDFEKCIGFLEESAKGSTDSLAYEALLICAVVYYCRPFSFNERDNPANASPRIEIDAFSDISASERALHNQCMTIRNKALAHAEWAYYPTQRSAQTNVISSQVYNRLSEDVNWPSLIALANKLMEQCHHQRAEYLRLRPAARPAL